MKSYLFVVQHAPHSGSATQELLDMLLTTAAFDQAVAVLFMDDGVFQLKTQQQPEPHGFKDTLAMFNALPLYEVQPLYVELESLQERGLTAADLNLSVELIPRAQVAQLFKQVDIVFCS